MDEHRELILDFLENQGIPLLGDGSDIVARFTTKLDAHNLPVTKTNLKNMIQEYGDEILNPIADVDFGENEDNY